MSGSTGGRRGIGTCAVWVGLFGIVGALVLAALPARAADGPCDEGKHWISVRAGYAKSRARLAANGSYGYGFSYTWFLARGVAWTASVQHDLLGRFGAASEIEVPFATEFTRHFNLGATARPYLGGGWGAIYHKTYRTGADESGFRQGLYVSTGANAVLDATSLIGFDLRMTLEQDTRSINPSFPNIEPSSTVWSAKVSYSRVF